MRRVGLVAAITVAAALGCAGEEAPSGIGAAPTPASPAPAAPAVAAADQPETWGEKYWVILQSDRDVTKAPPSLATIAAHPELALTPRRLSSSRFKNLMPCFEVVVADAKADKAAALALSRQLSDLGVDNYVKNAGPHVGRRPAVDAWCAASVVDAEPGGPLWAFSAGGSSWMLLGDVAAMADAARVGAGRPQMLDRETWAAGLSAESIGRWHLGDPVNVVAATGLPTPCRITRFADLTTGIAHFGVLQSDEPPTAPTCGEPALAAQLDCAVEGTALAAGPTAPPIAVWATGGPDTAPVVVDAARALLSGTPAWKEVEGWAEGPLTDALTVTKVSSGARTLWLAEAHRTADGGCGGLDEGFFALFDAATPGVAVAGPYRASGGAVRAVVDVGQGPELWLSTFPAGDLRVGPGGPRSQRDLAYCDCPC